jgi:hypothetical protein
LGKQAAFDIGLKLNDYGHGAPLSAVPLAGTSPHPTLDRP